MPCLHNKVYDLVYSPFIGEVPASGPGLRKLNDRKVNLGAPDDRVKSSQAQDTQTTAGRRISKVTLASLQWVLNRDPQSWFGISPAFHQANMLSDARRLKGSCFSPLRVQDRIQRRESKTISTRRLPLTGESCASFTYLPRSFPLPSGGSVLRR